MAEKYIPYATVAKASVDPDERLAEHLEYLGIPALPYQIDRLAEYINRISEVHVGIGIEIGLELSTKYPMSNVEAYSTGYADGQQDMIDLMEGDE